MAALSFSRLWPWLSAAFTGLLLALCFPPYNVGGLAFVALIPLLCAVWLKRPARRAGWYWFRLGYVSGLVFFSMTFSWLSHLAVLFKAWPLRFLSFYLALYLSLFVALWAWFAGWIVGKHFAPTPAPDPTQPFSRPPLLLSSWNLGLSVLLAAAWTTLEWARGLGALSFGWNGLGVALHKELALIQIADITGVPGLTFMLVLCNAIGLITILRLRAEIGRVRLRPHFDFSLTVALVVLVFSYGVRVLPRGKPPEGTVLRVGSLQPNTPQMWSLFGGHDDEIRENVRKLHEVLATMKPDLVLWPESSLPGGVTGHEENDKLAYEMSQLVPALLLGSDFDEFPSLQDPNDSTSPRANRSFNSAILLSRNGTNPVQVVQYHKQHLVPFGEYLPFRPLLEWAVGGLVPSDFTPGMEPGVFHLNQPPLAFAPLICFEDTVASLVRRPVQRGAQFLVNLTNDGWFGISAGPEQHFINSIFRAVENRRPLLRSTNTGITAAVDRFGQVERWLPPFQQGFKHHAVNIPNPSPHTFYTQHGDVFALGCLTLSVLSIIGRAVILRRR